jgi:hypothetical protein
VLDRRQRVSLAFFQATQLPLVLAITTLAHEGGHMRASTAASLVGAAVLSTLCFPILGLRLSGHTETRPRGGVAEAAAAVPAGSSG